MDIGFAGVGAGKTTPDTVFLPEGEAHAFPDDEGSGVVRNAHWDC
jgi:hypothetical protein